MRDYITHQLQEIQPLLEELRVIEQDVKGTRGPEKRDREKDAGQKRITILKEAHSPSVIYQFLAATGEADENAFRTTWQGNRQINCLQDEIKGFFEEYFTSPKIDLALLPVYSFVLQFKFTLAQPYISRDEQDFYIIDNPVRKDKILGLPLVASTSWKGSLRAALWQLGHKPQDEAIYHLFGNDKGEENQKKLHAGRLYFFPTFFTQISLEIINPHDRVRRVGKNPILFESVPGGVKGASGTFTLLYVPFDRIGKDKEETRKQVVNELKLVADGVQAMFRVYGFGAKTSSGFGLAKGTVTEGAIRLRTTIAEQSKPEAAIILQPAAPALPRYMSTATQLKPEYLTEEGTFYERSEAELKKMSKADKQKYDKAKSWWEREGKHLLEDTKQSEPAETKVAEPQAKPIVWPEWKFNSFDQLQKDATAIGNELSNGGRT